MGGDKSEVIFAARQRFTSIGQEENLRAKKWFRRTQEDCDSLRGEDPEAFLTEFGPNSPRTFFLPEKVLNPGRSSISRSRTDKVFQKTFPTTNLWDIHSILRKRGRIRFRRVLFQAPRSVSFSGLTEFQGESSVSPSQPNICVQKRSH